MPKISIIIPLYNKGTYILNTIQSVLFQEYEDYEVVIVDDGSTDDSVDIINEKIHSNKITIVSQPNAGPAAARNTGVRNAKGEWVVFLDADDELLPDALSTFDNLTKEHPEAAYITCNYYLQMNNKRWLFTNVKTDRILKHPFLFEYLEVLSGRPGSEIIHRDIMLKYPYNESLRRYEDAENQYRILNNCKVYQSSIPVMVSNRDASEAASFRKNFSEDFLGCMVFNGTSFWEKMQLYKLSLEAYSGYGEKASRLYNKTYANKLYRFTHKFYKIWKTLADRRKQKIVNFITFLC